MARPNLLEILVLFFRLILVYLEAVYRLFVPIKPKSIKDQIVLVTGAAQGIGRELAYEFSKHGAKLVLWDIDKEQNEETSNEIHNRGGYARAYVCDVSKYDDVMAVAEQVRQDVGDVDILVNNAGIISVEDFLKLDEKRIMRTMAVNCLAHFWTCKAFLPAMWDNNSGHIVTIASMSGKVGVPMLTDYTASKFAVVGFTESLEAEMKRDGKHGIYFTTVCPIHVDTNLVRGLGETKSFSTGDEELLQPDMVARITVEKTLQNQRLVCIPAHVGILEAIARCQPSKATALMMGINKAGFFYTEK